MTERSRTAALSFTCFKVTLTISLGIAFTDVAANSIALITPPAADAFETKLPSLSKCIEVGKKLT